MNLLFWTRYIHSICGIALDGTKAYLIETRLGPILKETGCVSFSELYYKAKTDASLSLRQKVLNAITTNETSFFRDSAPFELLRHKIVPELIDRRSKERVRPIPNTHLERRLLHRTGGIQHRHHAKRALDGSQLLQRANCRHRHL